MVNYKSPLTLMESGREDFINGVKRNDSGINFRTGANHIHYWRAGWDAQEAMTCKGENCTSNEENYGHSDECQKEHESNYMG